VDEKRQRKKRTRFSGRSSSSTHLGDLSSGSIDTHELDVSVPATAHFSLFQLQSE
jgi:hypothetical protein